MGWVLREIKFRAWDKAKNHMCFFGPEFDMDDDYNFLAFLTPKNIAGPLGDHNSMVRYELMQFTGLKDKNGVADIFEGDVVSPDGLIKGNIYESPQIYEKGIDCLIEAMGTKSWGNTESVAMGFGCFYAE